MAGELHQISEAIGELRARFEDAGRWRDRTSAKLDEIRDNIAATVPRVSALERRVDEMEPEIDSWRQAKYRAAGAIGIVSVASATISFIAAKFGTLIAFLHWRQ